MSNTRKIARKLFYTDDCDYIPSEEEERELNTRYGMEYPYKNKFNSMVDEYTSEEQEEKPTTSSPSDNPFKPYTRITLSEIIDQIEDDYNLDVNNRDPKKYKRLEDRFEDIKKQVWRKIMLSKLPDVIKQELGRLVDRAESFRRMYSALLMKVSKL